MLVLDTVRKLGFSRELFLDSKDISCFKNLDVWTAELENLFREKVLVNEGMERLNFDFEVFCNQLTLVLFLNGQISRSLELCSRIVSLYSHCFKKTKDLVYVEKCIQPLINTSRAYRIQGNSTKALEVLAPINVIEKKGNLEVFGKKISRECLQREVQDVLVYNSIIEPLKIFLRKGEFESVIDYLTLLQKQDRNRILACSEAEILARMFTGSFDEACENVLSAMQKCSGIKRLKFYIRLAEILCESDDHTHAKEVLLNFKNSLSTLLPTFKWNDLLSVNRVVDLGYSVFGTEEFSNLHLQLIQAYKVHSDEFHFLQQVISFQKHSKKLPGCLSEKELHEKLNRSRYARLHRQGEFPSLDVLCCELDNMIQKMNGV